MAGSRPDTWMPLYWGDYLRDTGHLSTAHHGAYLLMIGHYWSTGEALPDDDAVLWRIVRADSMAQWKKLRPAVVALFAAVEGKLIHRRIDAELTKASGRMAAASAKAKRAAEARWSGHDDIPEASNGESLEDAPSNARSNPQAMLEQCPSQPPSPSQSSSPEIPLFGFVESASSKRASRKAKLPVDWKPTPEQLAYAKQQGCPDPADTAERFRLHHLSKGTVGADWDLGFQYWCRNEKNFRNNGQAPGTARKHGGFNL